MPADQETLYLLTNRGDMTPPPPDLTLGSAVLPTHCASHQVSLQLRATAWPVQAIEVVKVVWL